MYLPVLAERHPPKVDLARWVKTELDREDPSFLPLCIEKQATALAERSRADGRTGPAPLAGVVIGKTNHAALYIAFFDAVKAGVIEGKQRKALSEGMTFAGVKSGEAITVSPADFIDPFTLITGSGNDIDLRAEGALIRLARSEVQMSRIYEGEDIKSRGEELAEKEKTFAHADVDLIGDALRREVFEKEGLALPNGTDTRQMRLAAEGITDPFLLSRVLEQMDRLDVVDDRARVYMHEGGDIAFRAKKVDLAGPWKPFTPTVDRDEMNSRAPAKSSRTANRQPKTPVVLTEQPKNLVSKATYDRMFVKLAELHIRKDQLTLDMGAALADGDLSESAFYDEVRNALMDVQNELAILELSLHDTAVGDVTGTNIGQRFHLVIGNQPRTVLLTDGTPMIGDVTTASPLGQQLLHARVGDTFTLSMTSSTFTPGMTFMAEPAGLFRTRLRRPDGILKPVLDDVMTTYLPRQMAVRHEHRTSRDLTVQVTAIVSPVDPT